MDGVLGLTTTKHNRSYKPPDLELMGNRPHSKQMVSRGALLEQGEDCLPERVVEDLPLILIEVESHLIADSEVGDGVLSLLNYHPKSCACVSSRNYLP